MKAKSMPQSTNSDRAISELELAHNLIIKAWFDHWNSQEQLRIDASFEKANRQPTPQRKAS